MLKLKWCLRDDVAGRRRLHIKAVCQSVREATTASGVDNAASPDWQTPLNGIIFTLRERPRSLCKTTGRKPRSILMSSVDRVAHTDGQLMQLLWAIHNMRFQRSINAQLNKTEQSIYECLLGFCLPTFSAPPQILAARQFSCPIPETKKWWVMVSFGATAAGLFWTVNVCWAWSQGQLCQRSSE